MSRFYPDSTHFWERHPDLSHPGCQASRPTVLRSSLDQKLQFSGLVFRGMVFPINWDQWWPGPLPTPPRGNESSLPVPTP